MDSKICELVALEYQLKSLKKKIKELEVQEDELKSHIVEKMECDQLSLFENEEIKIKRIAPIERESIDIEALKHDEPHIYERYRIVRKTKESVRITLKGGL